MIKSYLEFLNESIISKSTKVNFIISDRLVNIFEKISESDNKVGKLAKELLKLNNRILPSTITFLDIEDTKSISFIKAEKYEEIYDKEFGKYAFVDSSEIEPLITKYKKTSNNIKVGRLVLKLIELYEETFFKELEYTTKTIEDFTNQYKSLVDVSKGKMENFKVLPASEIPKYYLYTSYSSNKGSLGKSCMKYEESQDYLTFYTNNPNSLNILVYLDDEGKLLGRSLLWNLEDGNKFMDRVYTNNDYDLNLFIKWAEENKCIYKEEQDSYAYTRFYHPNSNYKKAEMVKLKVKVNPIKHEKRHLSKFPYLDTLKFFYWQDGILDNSGTLSGYYIELENTDGEFICDECETTGIIDCDYCNGEDVGCLSCGESKYLSCPTCGNFMNNKKAKY
jgi:hypothetical protein